MYKSLIADFSDNYAREPIIAVMPDGSLVCILTTGGPTEPHNDNYVVIMRSNDEGKTWSKPEKLFSHKRRGVWVTEIFTGGEAPMMIVHTYDGTNPYKELQTFVSYTYDNGKTWTEPVTITPYANGCSIRKGIVLSNGEYLFPVYFTRLYEGFGDFPEFGAPDFWKGTRHTSGVMISSDKGEHYMPYGDFNPHLWEPNCVELEDGHILMYMRDNYNPYMNAAESFDYGRTWNHIGNIDMHNANSKVTMEKVNEKVILVSNVCPGMTNEERKNLQIQISDDYCKTWREPIYPVDPEEMWCYPHMAVDYNKKLVYLAYENMKLTYVNTYTFDELGL